MRNTDTFVKILKGEYMNIVKEKSTEFGILIHSICTGNKAKGNMNVVNQLHRSGTAVGAMIREAEFAESKKDFIHKMSIAQKEVNESIYWIELLLSQSNEKVDDIEKAQLLAKDIFFILIAINKKAKKRN
jgi:four helix bundle protein